MPQSLSSVYIHGVFSTLDRTPFLADETLRTRTHEYLGGISRSLGCQPMCVGGVADHVHVLAAINRTIIISDWIKELKRASSLWLKSNGSPTFTWQRGYGAFYVSPSQLASVVNYIANQKEHHAKVSFQDELRALLREGGLEWDEKYLWE